MNPEPITDLIATVRASVRLRDGYYLREELVDLYLVGVLRGVAVGMLDADGPHFTDPAARAARLDELARSSAELLDQLRRLRPGPVELTPDPVRPFPADLSAPPPRSADRARSVARG